MQKLFPALILLALISCSEMQKPSNNEAALDKLAEKYVRLGLTIGLYDGDFVDAYYGPDSLKSAGDKQASFPKDSLLASVQTLQNELKIFETANDTLRSRANWMTQQLIAFSRRIKIFSGEYKSFNEESTELFGTAAPTYSHAYYDSLAVELDKLLPGKGSIADRFQQLASKFIIPVTNIDTVFKTAIAEARKRTKAHYNLPENESFTIEYVQNKPWSGYNWYKGNYHSIIQVNNSIPIFIERAIDLACHEGYPGHHVYNMLLEKNLYRNKGWVEISLYPLYSPQSLIAEGSGNYGIYTAFPGDEQQKFTKEILMPLAKLDTTNISLYFKALAIKAKLSFARNEAARGIVNHTMTDADVLQWMKNYLLMEDKVANTYLNFIKKYRSYVINYNYGQYLVQHYVEAKGGTDDAPDKRWQVFEWLLSHQVTINDLKNP